MFALVILALLASMTLVNDAGAQIDLGLSGHTANSRWSRTYGAGQVRSVIQTSDGGYVFAGDASILKLTPFGNVVWDKYYTRGNPSIIDLYSIEETTDGGLIAAGGISVLKTDSNGNIVWSREYYKAHISSIQQTSDGGYFVVGGNYMGYSHIGWVAKLDSSGNVTWQRSVSGSLEFLSGHQTSDGGYIVAGWTLASDVPYGVFGHAIVVKFDIEGNALWQYAYGTNYVGGKVASSVRQTIDGGYIVQGHSLTDSLWLLRLDGSGAIVWENFYPGIYETIVEGQLSLTSDGGYVVAGHDRTGLILRLDSTGRIAWTTSLGGSRLDAAASVQQTSDGGYVMGGFDQSFRPGFSDMWVAKLDTRGRCCAAVTDQQGVNITHENAPIIRLSSGSVQDSNIQPIVASIQAISTSHPTLTQCSVPGSARFQNPI